MAWSGVAGAMTGGITQLYGQYPGHRAYAEHQSCRLGRRKQSVRGVRQRACGGRLVDPDAPQRAAMQAIQMQHFKQWANPRALYGQAGAAPNSLLNASNLFGSAGGYFIPAGTTLAIKAAKAPSLWAKIKNFLA